LQGRGANTIAGAAGQMQAKLISRAACCRISSSASVPEKPGIEPTWSGLRPERSSLSEKTGYFPENRENPGSKRRFSLQSFAQDAL